MPRIGIIGFPNVGKTTLFNALTGRDAPVAAHPFTTVEPLLGVAVVPDAKLERAAELEGSAKLVHAVLELVDLPAFTSPEPGRGLALVDNLRDMDALAVVVRAFEDAAVPVDERHGVEPADQAEAIELEMIVADAEVFRRRTDKVAKEATADPSKRPAAAAIAAAASALDGGDPLRADPWRPEELAAFRDIAPLTLKPHVWVVNVGEDRSDVAALVESVAQVVPAGDTVVALSARLEAEAAQLDAEERAELYEGLGLGEGALAVIVHAAFEALGLISFYTLNPKEAHAWTVRRGATAREAAGKVHSDLERGFIRAEIAAMEDVIAAGGWDAARAAGVVRVEGREYAIEERDVMLVRFSV